ncbi:MAG TPA: hypothetical protein VD968_10665, partial [Pyrinomonadaceae bacterium]|nr:hypothetical protein [Pyrinomonadaceae bacterium]
EARFTLGRALAQVGELERAAGELREAVRLDDSIADGHFQLGRLLLRMGRKDEGERELERAKQLHNEKRASEGVNKP